MDKKELFKKDFARIRRKIEKYNADLAEYVKVTGDNEVPEIDCSIIGTSPMEPIEMKETENGLAYAEDNWWEEITVKESEGEYWLAGDDELDDLLRYNRRRLRKGRRVFGSSDPDIELEKDED